MVTLLDMEQEAYKAELNQALRTSFHVSTPYTCTLVDNMFAIKKKSPSGFLCLMLSAALEEIPLETSLPGFMTVIAQEMEKATEENILKEKNIESLTKGNANVFC